MAMILTTITAMVMVMAMAMVMAMVIAMAMEIAMGNTAFGHQETLKQMQTYHVSE